MSTFEKLQAQTPEMAEEKFNVPEWGNGEFVIKQITGVQFETIRRKARKEFGTETDQEPEHDPDFYFGLVLLTRTLYDSEGKQPKIEFLYSQSLKLLNRLSAKAKRLNGIGEEAEAEMEKN